MAKPRIGLLGVGRIEIMYARTLALRVEGLVAADVAPGKAQRAVDELDAQARSVEDFFDSEDFGDVAFTAPADAHAHHIEATIGLGAPVFYEKSVAFGIASMERTNAVAESVRVPVHISFQCRFDATYAVACKRLTAGEIGELWGVHMHTPDQAPAAREFLVASGDISIDYLTHGFDALRWITGREVKEVFAFGMDLGLSDFADFSGMCGTVLALRLTDGVLATAHPFRFSGAGHDVRMEVHGTEGMDVIGTDERLPVRSLEPGVAFPPGEPWVDLIARFAACYERELEAFFDVVAGKAEAPPTIDDAVASLRVTEACAAPCREDRPIKVAR